MPDLYAGVPVASNQPRPHSNAGREESKVRYIRYVVNLFRNCLCHVRWARESHPVWNQNVPCHQKEMLQTKRKA